jgi:DNA-binding CsgD family transcriptional regulator
MQYYLVKGYVRTGEIEQAQQVLGLDPGPQPAMFVGMGLAARLLRLVAAGEHGEAIEFAEARIVRHESVIPMFGEDWRPPLAEAYAGSGDRERAREVLREAISMAPASLPAHGRATLYVASARLEDDTDSAEQLYRLALELVDARHYQWAEAHLGLAEVHLERGQRESARRHAREAFQYAVREGARPLAVKARSVAARVTSPDEILPPDERLALLSPSEQRIAEAAARGERNREIARSQFVTIKTVEFHLGNIYRKLGIRSRTELASILDVVPDARGAESGESAS